MTKKFYIIDGNSYIYRAFYALPPLSTSKNEQVNAVYGFVRMVLKILTRDNPDYCVVCFDHPSKNFRHKMFEEYKANRIKMPNELISQIPKIKEFVSSLGIKSLELEGFEADDLIASLVEKISKENMDTVIISADKDILQLVNDKVIVYSEPKEIIYDTKAVIEKYGLAPDKIKDFISITGDASDNIPGVLGIGKVGALNLIKKYGGVKYILENIDSIDEKNRIKIKESIDKLKLSYELVGLNSHVPFDFNVSDYLVKDYKSRNEFKDFLNKMEFHGVIEKFFGASEELKNEVFIENKILNDISDNVLSVFLHKEEEIVKNIIIYTLNNNIWKLSLQELDIWKKQFENILKEKNKIFFVENLKDFYHFLDKIKLALNHTEFFDVVSASYLLDSSIQDLDGVVKKYIGKKIEDGTDDNSVYVNAKLLFDAGMLIKQKLKEDSLEDVYKNIDIPFCKVLMNMEKTGITLDIKYFHDFSIKLNSDIDSIVKEIYSEAKHEFNINSPKQLAVILFEEMKFPPVEKTKTGYSTSESVLKILAIASDFPKKILKYRELSKLKSTYVDVLPILADKSSSRVHTTFNYTNTATGRLSSSNPNLQNIPIRSEIGREIRKAFVSRSGYVLVSADYSQIDLTVLAHISKDEAMQEAFINGKDIHIRTASKIFNKEEDKITDKERGIAKRINFGLVYGMSAFGLSKDIGVSVPEADHFIKTYFLKYSKVKDYMNNMISFAKEKGYVQTIVGRRRYIPEIGSKINNIRMIGERMAINTPIQGSSSDIIKKAMVDLAHAFEKYSDSSIMLLQIHDEIIFEVKENMVDEIIAIVQDKMEHAFKLDVPLRVSIAKGKSWGEME